MTILDNIVRQTRNTLRERRAKTPVSTLRAFRGFDDDRRSFEASLAASGLSVIAEIKRASPSKGQLRETLDVRKIAGEYESGGAAAISVLTEPEFFRGSLADLRTARSESAIPLLRKDFVIDPYQVFEARAYGADAVLLIATVLEKNQLSELVMAAAELGLDHLVEVYSEKDLEIVDFDLVRILGVNTRDLETFEVDISRLPRVFSHVPRDLIRVAESGISGPSDIAPVVEAGVDAVLIGEALVRSDDPANLLRTLIDEAAALAANTQPSRNEAKA